MTDFLDDLLHRPRDRTIYRGIEPGYKRSCNLVIRHFRSLNRGRISVDECKRRLRRNYLRTGTYWGPLGWCDESDADAADAINAAEDA